MMHRWASVLLLFAQLIVLSTARTEDNGSNQKHMNMLQLHSRRNANLWDIARNEINSLTENFLENTPKKAVSLSHHERNENICLLPPVHGRCRARITRFHYDSVLGACAAFTYGGCGTNGNNFETMDACVKKCSNVQIQTTTTVSPGECRKYKCVPCEYGYMKDYRGCQTCNCKNFPDTTTTETVSTATTTTTTPTPTQAKPVLTAKHFLTNWNLFRKSLHARHHSRTLLPTDEPQRVGRRNWFCFAATEFRCRVSGICLDRSQRCNGINECGAPGIFDRSDEFMCKKPNTDEGINTVPTKTSCVAGEFKCRHTGRCVLRSMVCDGWLDCCESGADCWDQSDEETCTARSISISYGHRWYRSRLFFQIGLLMCAVLLLCLALSVVRRRRLAYRQRQGRVVIVKTLPEKVSEMMANDDDDCGFYGYEPPPYARSLTVAVEENSSKGRRI